MHRAVNKAYLYLAKSLIKKHHTVRVVMPALYDLSRTSPTPFFVELNHQGIHIASCSGVKVFSLNNTEVHAVVEPPQLRPYLVKQIDQFEPDWILMSSENDSGHILLDAALQTGLPRIGYLVFTPSLLPFGPHAFLPSLRKTKLFEQITEIIACSQATQQYIREWSGLESSVFYWPIYGSGPFPYLGNFDAEFVTIINPSTFKGIKIFLELASRLPNIQFAALPGWGTTSEDQAALEALSNIRLLRPVKNIDDIFAQTRVLLMPSLGFEGFPLTAGEAMLRGIPVLASNIPGLRETMLGIDFVLPVRPIEHYTDRFDKNRIPIPMVPHQDVCPWQNSLLRVLSNRTYYERLSVSVRRKAYKFVSRLSFDPLEEMLISLDTKSTVNKNKTSITSLNCTQQRTLSEVNNIEVITNLTTEQQALLMLWLQGEHSDNYEVSK